jgi:PAS domain S-box-containing protein
VTDRHHETRQRKPDTLLQESEQRFHDMVEGSIQGILIHRNHKPLYVNDAWAELHGFTRDAVLAMDSVVPLMAAHERERLQGYKDARLRGESAPVRYEYQGLRSDGSLIWLDNLVRMVRWDGEPAIQTTVIDNTAKKMAEEAMRADHSALEAQMATRTAELEAARRTIERNVAERRLARVARRENDRRLEDFADIASDWFWEQDANLRFSYFSERIEEVTGVPTSHFLGRTRQDFFESQGTLDENTRAHLETIAAHKDFRDFSYRFRTPGGDWRVFQLSGKAVFDEHGQFRGYRGVATDVTVEVEAKRRASEANARLADALESLPEAIVLYDADDRLVVCNGNFKRFYFHDAETFITPGRTYEELARRLATSGRCPDASRDPEAWVQAKLTWHRSGGEPVEYALADGRWMMSAEHLTSDGGVLCFHADVSRRKQTEQELKEYRKHLEELVAHRTAALEATNVELDAFSYSVSHDLRAPLRAIEGFSGAILEDHGAELDQEVKDLLGRVTGASKRMSRLIEALLRMSRTTRRAMSREAVDLSALGRSIGAQLQQVAPERSVEFHVEPGMRALCDPHLVRVALEMLLDNAWKYTRQRDTARIEMGSFHEDERRAYFIRDNGVGFDMQYADKLFVPLQRLHGEAEYEGTGIGLATVASIVRRHGGHTWAEGTLGAGATFRFTLGPGA